jgi:putative ABC transport system ATP-binding protein
MGNHQAQRLDAAKPLDRGPFIEAAGIAKRFPAGGDQVAVLQDVDLVVTAGEIVAILGVSGTGKSTLLNVLGGIDRPTAGRIRVGEHDVGTLSDQELTGYRRDMVGFVFQFYNLIPSFTALENVLSALEAAQRFEDGDETRARELLAAVGLAGKADKFPEELSGGEQQRVAIARALIKKPPLILADEPTGNLDPETGQKVLRVLVDETRSTGATLLLVTHNPDLGAAADRRLALVRGRLVAA